MNESPPHPQTTVDFRGIIEWYQSHCDNSWEHHYGVRLETLDNPGWQLTVDLIHTNLQGQTMTEIREGITSLDWPDSPRWIHCCVKENKFQGACDPTQVARLFEIFNQFKSSAPK
jgi:hypothetical protein